jgi:hypothetical protein
MPDARNFARPLVMINSINDPVGPKDDLANVLDFGIQEPCGRTRENFEVGRSLRSVRIRKTRTVRIVAPNKDDDIVEVVQRCGRPDQLESHEANCRLTSS